MKNDYLVIASGHLNNKEKEKQAINFLKKLKSKVGHPICYVTHSKNIPDKVIDLSDYLVYTKQNPIMNWDFRDDWTTNFCALMHHDNKRYIMPLPIASLAMHLSICDGMILGMNAGFKKFHYFNSDCDDVVFDKMIKHEQDLDGVDVVFQQQDFINNRVWVNAEFFTCNDNFAKIFCKYKNYNHLKTLCDVRMETYFADMVLKNKLKYIVKENKEPTQYGKFGFNTNCVQENSYFKYSTYTDPESIFIPFIENGKHSIILSHRADGELSIEINDEKTLIENNSVKIIDFDLPAKIKMYYKDEEINNCDFVNDKQFGIVQYKQ